jgi:hypothetical protein
MNSLIPIDTIENSSYLDYKKLKSLQNIIDSCADALSLVIKKRDTLKKVQKHFIFEKVFSNMGVQGITGILKVKETGEKVVFKISVDLNKSVEHENIITKELNKLRPYCPHFVGNIGMINLPVSNDFINNPDKQSLFKNSNDYFPCNVLLIEYVSPISLYHVCKYLHDTKSIIISQLTQILMAFDIAQVKCKLTHYDAHLDNILIRKIDENVLFLYKHRGRNILIPTYGLYPVVIDMGSSYVKATEGNPMYTNAENYHNGLQPTLYDNLNDIHHLLLSVFYYLEDKKYVYDFMRVKTMYSFKHLPLLAKKGWKQLPYNIFKLILKRIKTDCPEVKSFPVYKAFSEDIIDVLNGLIILPWNEVDNDTFKDCFIDFLSQLQKIYDIEAINNNDDILYVLRETVDLINLHRESYSKDKSIISTFIKDWKDKVAFVVSGNMKAIPKNLDFEKLFQNAIKVADRMSSNYYKFIKSHVNTINEAYLQTKIKSPIDAVDLLLQNATPSFTLTKENIIYIWDSEDESKRIVLLNSFNFEQLEKINDAPIKKKGDIFMNMIYKN